MAKDRGRSIALIVDAIRKVGARNYSLISRVTKIPDETVRYKVEKQFGRLGLAVQLSLDYNRLGLKAIVAELEFNPELGEKGIDILHRLANVAYLIYYARVFPQTTFYCWFAVPVRAEREFFNFLDELEAHRVLQSYSAHRLSWARHLSLRPEFYDFSRRKWHVDWEKVEKSADILVEPPVPFEPPETPDLDYKDMLIIKELQLNALQRFSKISRKLRINAKVLRYHYQRHVKRLVSSYYVRWLRGYPNEEKKRVVQAVFLFSGLTEEELNQCRQCFNTLPFTWREGGSKGSYLAEAMIPPLDFTEALRFVRQHTTALKDKTKIWFLDMDEKANMAYTIPYEMFDQSKGWTFDRERAAGSLLAYMPRAKTKKERRSS